MSLAGGLEDLSISDIFHYSAWAERPAGSLCGAQGGLQGACGLLRVFFSRRTVGV